MRPLKIQGHRIEKDTSSATASWKIVGIEHEITDPATTDDPLDRIEGVFADNGLFYYLKLVNNTWLRAEIVEDFATKKSRLIWEEIRFDNDSTAEIYPADIIELNTLYKIEKEIPSEPPQKMPEQILQILSEQRQFLMQWTKESIDDPLIDDEERTILSHLLYTDYTNLIETCKQANFLNAKRLGTALSRLPIATSVSFIYEIIGTIPEDERVSIFFDSDLFMYYTALSSQSFELARFLTILANNQGETEFFASFIQAVEPIFQGIQFVLKNKNFNTFIADLDNDAALPVIEYAIESQFQFFMTSMNPFTELYDYICLNNSKDIEAILSDKKLQEKIKKIHWSAFKLAKLLTRFDGEHCQYELISKMPCFADVSDEMWDAAFELNKMSEQFAGLYLLDHACAAFTDDTGATKAPETIFTHSDDFPNTETLIYALNITKVKDWYKIFSLPGVDKTLELADDIDDLLEILDVEKRQAFESKSWLEVAQEQLSLEKQLELDLRQLDPKNRLTAFLANESMIEAFTTLLAAGEGKTVIAVLSEHQATRAEQEKMVRILQKGYKEYDSQEDLDRKKMHFFSYKPEPRSFLVKLQQELANTTVQATFWP
ncbi:MAG: hypothetical protein WC627_09455 [Legionella sp.]|jgi:hypothetical protein